MHGAGEASYASAGSIHAPSPFAPLAAAGHLLGQAYQICDDMLDAGQSNHMTGKTSDQDPRHKRPSHSARFDAAACFVKVVGMMEEARRLLLDGYGHSDGVHGLIGFVDKIFASTLPNGAAKIA